jgi:hypothetical protein
MKQMKWLLLIVLLASLALGLAACGGDTEPTSPPAEEPTQASSVQPTDEPAQEPTAAPEPTTAPADTALPEPTETTEVEEEFDLSALSSTEELSSYRSTMWITTVTDTNGEEEEQTIEVSIEYTSEPRAQHISMSGGAVGAEGEAIEMYLVEDKMYMKMGTDWLSMPATEEDMDTDAMLTPDDLLSDLCGWKKEGREEINGIQTQHWSFSKDDFDKCAGTDAFLAIGELTDAGGDLYVAEDENYIVLMEVFYEGENLDLGLGEAEEGTTAHRVEVHYEMSDVNDAFTIEVPAEALESGALPEDIPFPEDAVDVNQMFGMITFTSAQAPDAIFEFYKAEMPNNGWTENSAEAMTGLWMMEYAMDGRTASIMISEGDEGTASVMITVTEPE